jgi:RsiW-degrading membrane proteinase PrsW (M82 family)
VAFFFIGTYHSEAAGMMLGFTSAIGFSSLETAGYGFNAFMSNVGQHDAATLANVLANPWSVLVLDASFVSRSLVDPVGHGTWTALTCYVLFHECRKAGRFVLNRRVVGAFVLAVLLHAAWDTSLLITPPNTYEYVAIRAAFFITLIFNVWLFVRIVRKVCAKKGTATESGVV